MSDNSVQETNLPYRRLIGCLIHNTQTTRPDLCASTYYVSRFQNCYTNAKRILSYVQGTKNLKLVYLRNEAADVLVTITITNLHLDSGYVFKVFGNTVRSVGYHENKLQ